MLNRRCDHKEQLDINETVTGPIVDAARLFAVDAGVSETNTVDRLTALRVVEYTNRKVLTRLQEAFKFLTLLRLEIRSLISEISGELPKHKCEFVGDVADVSLLRDFMIGENIIGEFVYF